MIKLWANIQNLSVNIQIALDIFCLLSFCVCLPLNNAFKLTLPQAIVFFALLPLFAIYVTWALFGMLAFVILSSALLHLRQKSLLLGQAKVNAQMRQKGGHPYRAWHQYGRISAHLATLCRDIGQISRFWSLPLSIIFLSHITLHDYILYGLFFIESVDFFEKLILLYVIINIEIAFFLLIDQCSKVVKHNRAIVFANRRFFMVFQKMDGFSSIGLTNMLKVRVAKKNIFGTKANPHYLFCFILILFFFQAEARQLSHRLSPYAFQLFDGYRITSKTFYLVRLIGFKILFIVN